LENSIDTQTHTEIIVTRLNSILLESSKECLPPGGKRRTPGNFKWTPELKPYVQKSKLVFWKWKQAGRLKDTTCQHYNAMKAAKHQLRQAQRGIAAKGRQDLYEEIMSANENDSQLLYKLIKKQRKSPFSGSSTIVFPSHIIGGSETDKWRSYFQNLATPKDLQEYDNEHKAAMVFRRLILSTLPQDEPQPEITDSLTKKHISTLKNNKAPDSFGISSEHIKLASERIVHLLSELTTRAFSERTILADLKMGIATPVPKKDRSQTDPDKFRRITITSLLGKVIEKHMVYLSDSKLSASQSPLQFGFTKDVPCSTASVLLTEVIAHHRDTKTTMYLTFMDASKAFDVVDHDCIMNHLYDQGITGELWHLYNSLYSDVSSMIKWQGQKSKPFQEGQGIRQGGISSTNIFKAKANPSLNRLQEHPGSLHIGSIPLGALMVADDLVLSAISTYNMQGLVSEAQLDASRERFSFSKTKTKTMVLQPMKRADPIDADIYLYESKLETSVAETHLGIVRSSDCSNTITINNRVKTSRRAIATVLWGRVYMD
jgi:hypothetical protein